MKTSKTSKAHTQIADISVNGRELKEEHLRCVSGGTTLYPRPSYYPTKTLRGWVRDRD